VLDCTSFDPLKRDRLTTGTSSTDPLSLSQDIAPMAIAKWIQFGNPQVTPNESTKPDPVPPVSSADAKKFGLENVRFRPVFLLVPHSSISPSP
jgi:hypothetical protein